MSDRQERPEQGVLDQLPDIWPEQAPPRIRPVYEDLRTALRVPDVPFAFRYLANWPPYLAFAVRQFTPFVRTLAFEAAAETLRGEIARALTATPRTGAGAARALVLREHEVAPKVLLVLTAFAVGLRGRATDPTPPLGTALPEQEPLPIRPAELPRMVDERIAPLPDLRSVPDSALDALEALATLRGVPTVDDFSRALAAVEARALVELVRLRREHPASMVESLRARIDELTDRLVQRFTLPGGKVLPDFMVPVSDLATIDAVVAALRAVAREAVIDVTLARVALDGPEAAERSPYPVNLPVA
ncbi:MAG: hypothetical protein RMK01_06375 [Thermomicrobium sp.]|nr:hypothetical protein [Thermomicrobium sp.]